MPRKARKISNSGIYHVMFRGINKQTIFEDDEDKEKFIYVLIDCKKKSKFIIYSYCLMKNHVHMLIKTDSEPLGEIMKRIGVRYIYWYNQKYQRCGHLFQDRFRSEPVENDRYFMTALRYIHRNPVKAGLVDKTDEYKWSSYNDYFKLNSQFVDTKFGLSLFSENKKLALCAYREYMNTDTDDECLEIEEKKIKLTDNELINQIKERHEIESAYIKNMNQQEQNEILRWMKYNTRASIRQIARVTGVTASKVSKL